MVGINVGLGLPVSGSTKVAKAGSDFEEGDLLDNRPTQNPNENLEERAMWAFLDEVGETDELRPRDPSHRHVKPSEGHAIFRVVYLLAFLLIFILASLVLFCMVQKKLGFNISDSELDVTTVLVYGGKKNLLQWPDPPPHKDLAAVARYVMHISEWGSLSTTSTHKGIEGYPFVNVFSVSDGPIGNATGVPYFYFTPVDLSMEDVAVDNKVSFTVSEAQSNYCNRKGFDPEDPRCAHIIFTGVITKVDNAVEELFAKDALFSRHEEMKYWPKNHDWFFAKLDISHIYVLDYFGGFGVVSTDDYFSSNPFKKN